MTHSTETATKPRSFKRHDLAAVLPELARRVRTSEFASLEEVATSYRVDKATACRWKSRAVTLGLIEERTWRLALLRAQMRREMAA